MNFIQRNHSGISLILFSNSFSGFFLSLLCIINIWLDILRIKKKKHEYTQTKFAYICLTGIELIELSCNSEFNYINVTMTILWRLKLASRWQYKKRGRLPRNIFSKNILIDQVHDLFFNHHITVPETTIRRVKVIFNFIINI